MNIKLVANERGMLRVDVQPKRARYAVCQHLVGSETCRQVLWTESRVRAQWYAWALNVMLWGTFYRHEVV